ncbi:MAG TPA: hypothetical protein VMV75_06265 [Sulfuricella sp.]|nr:hypothetical protein [Sulfuricella sp.]
MKQLLHKFILGFLLLWLPLQGFAATGMSFCRHDHTPPHAMQTGMHHDHNGGDCSHGQDAPSASSSQTQCDDCGYCHLGGAPALLPALFGLNNTAGFSFKFAFDSHLQLFFPEQPQRPPLTRFS